MASVLPTAYTAEAKCASCEANEMVAKTEKSPQLQPPSTSPCAGAETTQRLRILAELATIGEIGIAATAFSRGTLNLAQLYNPIRQSRGATPSTPQPQKTPAEVSKDGMVVAFYASSSNDNLSLENLYRARLQKTNDVKPAFIRKDSNDCSTISPSISSSEAAEQIWQEMKNDIIDITDEDDWSFTVNSKSRKNSLYCSEDNDAMIPAAVVSGELAEDVLDGNRKRRRLSNWEAFVSSYSL